MQKTNKLDFDIWYIFDIDFILVSASLVKSKQRCWEKIRFMINEEERSKVKAVAPVCFDLFTATQQT